MTDLPRPNITRALGVGPYALMLEIAGAFWGAAFLLFLFVYRPVLWRPRLGESAQAA